MVLPRLTGAEGVPASDPVCAAGEPAPRSRLGLPRDHPWSLLGVWSLRYALCPPGLPPEESAIGLVGRQALSPADHPRKRQNDPGSRQTPGRGGGSEPTGGRSPQQAEAGHGTAATQNPTH